MLNYTYEEVHRMIRSISDKIKADYDPEVIIAIGGGGLVPARILRTYLNIPILVVSTVAYSRDKLLDKIVCTQWVYDNLAGKRVLLVDEVDDSGTTIKFCLDKLISENLADRIAIFTINCKNKKKHYSLGDYPDPPTYFCCQEIDDVWVNYPWDQEQERDSSSTPTGTMSIDPVIDETAVLDTLVIDQPIFKVTHTKGFISGMCLGMLSTGLWYMVKLYLFTKRSS